MKDRSSTVIILVVALAVVAGALWWWLRPAPVAIGAVFVGDSVTYLSASQLEQAIGSKHPVVIARIGYRSTDLLPLFRDEVRSRKKAGRPLDQVALLVGYNDVLKQQPEAPALRAMMDQAGEFDCAVWLTLPSVPMHERETDRWNERVRALAKGHRTIHVVEDWRKAVEAAPKGKLLRPTDGVHPNAAGSKRLTEIFADSIHSDC